MLIDHIPHGNPICTVCGVPVLRHRAEHRPKGDPCRICNLPASRHRVRSRTQLSKTQDIYLGIDGEGQGRKHHKYVLLAASDETGNKKWWVEDENGLSTERCFDFFLNLPSHNTRAFTYSFGYDLTKILEDLPDEKLWLLFRPELRQRTGPDAYKGPRPIRWRGYSINLQGTKFTLSNRERRIVIWDVWKFFQGKFVSALTDWKVGSPELHERMTRMKDQRADFDKLSKEEVRDYCFEECMCMAQLARKLVNAHEAAELNLTSFYGAGSTASAMLKKMGIKDKIKPPPKDMTRPVASAFFGGRFENSVVGSIEEPVYNYDISSAYPYQLCFLPCLLHGRWEHTTEKRDILKANAALVHYSLGPNPRISDWGPFPFRTAEGSICYPITSGGGWVWKDEFLQGDKLFPHVIFEEAWVYHTSCDCVPFQDIPRYYLERIKIGKEGPGIVIKLGMNSNYGKLAQSVGKGIFNSWVWAGIITSNTRAMILEFLGLHKNRANMLMVATDGIYTRERFETLSPDSSPAPFTAKAPIPNITGTELLLDGTRNKKPLGGWEEKYVPQGVFVARPGIYFPLNPTKEDIKSIRGRGVGKGVVLENHEKITTSWKLYGPHRTIAVANVSRFCGAKTSVSRSGPAARPSWNRADGVSNAVPGKQMPAYGQWVTRNVEMSFDPMPKRERVNEDGLTLKIREMLPTDYSTPYAKAMRSMDSKVLESVYQEMLEQPDADLSDYEVADV